MITAAPPTKTALKKDIETFFKGFFDTMEFYVLPRGIGFTGYKSKKELTAYVEANAEMADDQHLHRTLEGFKNRFLNNAA